MATLGAVSDEQGTAAAGTLTTTATSPRRPRSTCSYNGKQFDLGSVAYLEGDTAGQRMTKLNNAANAALGTTGTPFVAGGTTTVVFHRCRAGGQRRVPGRHRDARAGQPGLAGCALAAPLIPAEQLGTTS